MTAGRSSCAGCAATMCELNGLTRHRLVRRAIRAATGTADAMSPWVYNPHVGGVRVPPHVRHRTEQRIRTYAEAHYTGTFKRLEVRFRRALLHRRVRRRPRPMYRFICADCDTLETTTHGAWRSTRIATRSTSRACSGTGRSLERQRKPSKLRRSISRPCRVDRLENHELANMALEPSAPPMRSRAPRLSAAR